MPAEREPPDDLAVLQRRMVRAVHGDAGAFATTLGSLAGQGIAADKRLFLHLNTVAHALTGVLRQAYPATARLLGPERFAALARAFLQAAPPRRSQLSGYGAGFEAFVAGQADPDAPQAAALARLDWAVQEAYFAADAPALGAGEVAAVPEQRHAGLRLVPVPSARLLALPAGSWELWRGLAEPGTVMLAEPAGRARGPAAGALVWRRPDLAVAARPLTGGERACLAALAGGAALLAAAAASEAAGGLDLAALLTDALAGGLFRAWPPQGP